MSAVAMLFFLVLMSENVCRSTMSLFSQLSNCEKKRPTPHLVDGHNPRKLWPSLKICRRNGLTHLVMKLSMNSDEAKHVK